ncbi:hypothetical protein [Nocardia sp. XZ_19_385]|uniref:hypothetical protein n=1 Tax=Nocardia sp. XZ_19_385 TaxID=2769488 RepID=UPI00188F41B2|nr:hypothetical protein [Nocardia sp. XZ_19_385]
MWGGANRIEALCVRDTLVLRRLAARWRDADRRYDDLMKQRLLTLVPRQRSGLYQRDHSDPLFVPQERARHNGTTIEDEHANLTAALLAAEIPRQSIRTSRNPPARETATPSRDIDKSRMTPAVDTDCRSTCCHRHYRAFAGRALRHPDIGNWAAVAGHAAASAAITANIVLGHAADQRGQPDRITATIPLRGRIRH